uniref:Uncharacterized protein n=1 Tax=Setaria viridis TaxID=4556 RepID=A0A4U6VT36_SETVI|nr:hypothetical protein SEVIR_2G208150v2 [Setaria viridis]
MLVGGITTLFVDFVLPTVGSGFNDLNVSLVYPQENKDMLTKRRCWFLLYC